MKQLLNWIADHPRIALLLASAVSVTMVLTVFFVVSPTPTGFTSAHPASKPSTAPSGAAEAPPSDAQLTEPEVRPEDPQIPADSCTNTTGTIVPAETEYITPTGTVHSDTITVGKDDKGNPGAPSYDEPLHTAWYQNSARVGSTKGNVILTAHTFHNKQALGNMLYGKNILADGKGGLKGGDVIKLRDAEGNQVCYRYRSSAKIMVDGYDPDSGVFHNAEGKPQIALMICWDYLTQTKQWDSRIIFYADYMKPGEKV